MALRRVSCKSFIRRSSYDLMLIEYSWTPLQPATKNNPAESMDSLGVGACPLNRPGMPVEMATCYVHLASPLGSYCTGEVLHGSGGIEMQG